MATQIGLATKADVAMMQLGLLGTMVTLGVKCESNMSNVIERAGEGWPWDSEVAGPSELAGLGRIAKGGTCMHRYTE